MIAAPALVSMEGSVGSRFGRRVVGAAGGGGEDAMVDGRWSFTLVLSYWLYQDGDPTVPSSTEFIIPFASLTDLDMIACMIDEQYTS